MEELTGLEDDIIDVLYSEVFDETKKRFWKKQLNLMSNGTYVVEIISVEFCFETPDFYNPVKRFNNETDALNFYNKILNINQAKRIFK